MQAQDDSLRDAVLRLCRSLHSQVSPAVGRRIDAVARRLAAPLQVAVAGRVNVGKSTLVNTLLGLKVARTDEGECTRLVALFRRGTSDLVTVVSRDGRKSHRPLDADGMLPADPLGGEPSAAVAHLLVTLTSGRLDGYEIIDTPGLLSVNTAISDSTHRLLGGDQVGNAPLDVAVDAESLDAALRADVVVYLYAQQVHEQDVQALRAFRELSARLLTSPVNTIPILNKIDKLPDDPTDDPWPTARRIAAKQTTLLGQVAGGVVPLIGRLAESTTTGLLTSDDCAALRTLATVADREVLLLNPQSFVATPCDVAPRQRERLLALLDLFGVAFALRQLDDGHLPDPVLLDRLRQASGVGELSARIDQVVRRRADLVKAAGALAQVEQLARFAPAPDQLLISDAVDRLRLDPAFYALSFAAAVRRYAHSELTLAGDLADDLHRMAVADAPAAVLGVDGPGQLRARLTERIARWRAYAAFGDGNQRRIAQDVLDGLSALHVQVSALGEGSS